MRAVVFDLGGVVLDSPMPAVAEFEREMGLAPGSVNRAAGTPGSAWASVEKGEMSRDAFVVAFGSTLGLPPDAVASMLATVDSAITPRPRMIGVLERLRAGGLKLAALTNNWEPITDERLRSRFDVFLESVVEGVRKPEPEFFLRCLGALQVAPPDAVMVDDIGANLKVARALGMFTIKFDEMESALAELGGMVAIDLS